MAMNEREMDSLRRVVLAPYIQLATPLISKPRRAGGNMFRHQMDTLGILIDYGYFEHVLLKASVIHDLVEDVPGFDVEKILAQDDGHEVLELVREVTRLEGETKEDFLGRIRRHGSRQAKVLKVADRISNMVSLGLVNDLTFVKRYILESALYVYPVAEEVDPNMAKELRDLISSRMDLLAQRILNTHLQGGR